MAIKDNLTFKFIPILLNMVMLYHNNNHINLIKELIEVKNLILHNLFLGKKRIESF